MYHAPPSPPSPPTNRTVSRPPVPHPMHQPQYHYTSSPGVHDPYPRYMPQVFPWQTGLSSTHNYTLGHHPVASVSGSPLATLHNRGQPRPPSITPAAATSLQYVEYVPTTSQSYPPYPIPPSDTPQAPTTAPLSMHATAFVPKQRENSVIKIRGPNSAEMVNLAAAASPIIGPSETKSPTLAQDHARSPTMIRIKSEEARKKVVENEQWEKETQRVTQRQRDVERRMRKHNEEVGEHKGKEKEDRIHKQREQKSHKKEKREGKERIRLGEHTTKLAPKTEGETTAEAKANDGELLRKEAKEKENATTATGFPTSLTMPSLSTSVPTDQPELKRSIPDPLDLTRTSKRGLPPSLPSALATARAIDNLEEVHYPEGIISPKPELNAAAAKGQFRYDRDFPLQSTAVCKEKPDQLPALDAISINSTVQDGGLVVCNRGHSHSRSLPGSVTFTSPPTPITHITSQGGSSPPAWLSTLGPSDRMSSQYSGKRHNSAKIRGKPSMQVIRHTGPSHSTHNSMIPLGSVEPLRAINNRLMPMNISQRPPAQEFDSPAVVERKVKGLLNKLTVEKFDSISDQIISWANRSEKENDGRTLIQVIRLVFEKATDEAPWSEMYARLCRKMMEQISQNVRDVGICSPDRDGKPIAGGQLFRKYLLNRCQEDFERGWSIKAAHGKAARDVADEANAVGTGEGIGEEVLYSEGYYVAQKAKRQGLGLVKFIGELFKLQMLTERIMHQCIKKLLESPEEEEIESLRKLLSTVGKQLDTSKWRSYMDVYLQRMKELTKSSNIASRMQYMLLDVLELRERKWNTPTVQAAPTTIAAVHEQTAKARYKVQIEKDQSVRAMGQDSMSRGASRRGKHPGVYGAHAGSDRGTSVAAGPPRTPTTARNLIQVGEISKGSDGPLTFGPRSFAKKETKSGEATPSRTNLISNIFAMPDLGAAAERPAPDKSSHPPSREYNADVSQTCLPEALQFNDLVLLPRTNTVARDTKVVEEGTAPSEADEDEDEHVITEDQANTKINEDVKEFWAVRNLEEAVAYFPALPAVYKPRLVDKLVGSALERNEADAQLVADLFTCAAENDICSSLSLEEGFISHIVLIDDMAIDVPAAYKLMAILIKGSKLPKGKVEELTGKIAVKGNPVVHPRDKLLREYEKLDYSP